MDDDWKYFIGKTIANVSTITPDDATWQELTRIEFTDGSWLVLRGWDDGSVFIDKGSHDDSKENQQ